MLCAIKPLPSKGSVKAFSIVPSGSHRRVGKIEILLTVQFYLKKKKKKPK